jgi:hypothetical protein
MHQTGVLVAPGWCDPERRRFRYSWDRILLGVMYADRDKFAFVARSGEAIQVRREDCRLEWQRGKGFGIVPNFDLITRLASYRFYLSRPSTTAPFFDAGTVADIGERTSSVGSLTLLGGTLGMAADVLGTFGDLATLPREISELRNGRRAAAQLKAIWA